MYISQHSKAGIVVVEGTNTQLHVITTIYTFNVFSVGR